MATTASVSVTARPHPSSESAATTKAPPRPRCPINPRTLYFARMMTAKSLEECAKGIRVAEEIYSEWESGELQPTVTQLQRVAAFHGLPFAWFFLTEGFFNHIPPERRKELGRSRRAP